MPEDGYGWEKLFSERMCRHFYEDYGLETRVARFHNIYGPLGTFDGGREKAPAAICRKVIEAKINNQDTIDVWGDGTQTRSFLYIDDCIDAVLKLFHSDFRDPINIGSDEKVTINQLISIAESFANKEFKKNYQLDKPQGVKGRSSNNDLIKEKIGWNYKYSLKQGIEKTYNWIENIYLNKKNDEFVRFTKKKIFLNKIMKLAKLLTINLIIFLTFELFSFIFLKITNNDKKFEEIYLGLKKFIQRRKLFK